MAKLIVIDGLDGSGKATQSSLVTDKLNELGYKVKKISFPDYESNSSALVKMYLDGEFGDDPNLINAYASSTFFAVDRVGSYLKTWKKDYDENEFIICDRYTTSNVVHQMSKMEKEHRDEYINWLFDFEYNKLGIPSTDMVIFLDLDPIVSQKLMSSRYHGDETKKDIHEKNVNYLNACREGAQYAIEKLDWVKVDCTKGDSIEEIEVITEKLIKIILDKFS